MKGLIRQDHQIIWSLIGDLLINHIDVDMIQSRRNPKNAELNPAHVNAEWAKKGIFGERIAHGILVTGLISAVIVMKLPGQGTIYMEQDAKFLKPVKIGDTVMVEVEIAEIIDESKKILRLNTAAYNQKGELVVDGYAVVKTP